MNKPSDLHAKIMNIQDTWPDIQDAKCEDWKNGFKNGHRDARHAAAELANEAADELERKDAAIAELVAELKDCAELMAVCWKDDMAELVAARAAIAKHEPK